MISAYCRITSLGELILFDIYSNKLTCCIFSYFCKEIVLNLSCFGLEFFFTLWEICTLDTCLLFSDSFLYSLGRHCLLLHIICHSFLFPRFLSFHSSHECVHYNEEALGARSISVDRQNFVFVCLICDSLISLTSHIIKSLFLHMYVTMQKRKNLEKKSWKQIYP